MGCGACMYLGMEKREESMELTLVGTCRMCISGGEYIGAATHASYRVVENEYSLTKCYTSFYA